MSAPTDTAPYAGGLTRSQVVRWRNAMFVIFAVCGIGMSSWVSRVPAIRDSLGANTLQMGILIFGVSLGSIIGLLLSSHIVARYGAKGSMRACFTIAPIGFAIAGIGATVGPSFILAFAGLAVFGAAYSVCDVAMNVQGAANERVLRRAIMPIYHGFFSFGTMIGAGVGALAESIGVPIIVHMLFIAVVMFTFGQLALRYIQSEHLVDGDEADAAASAHSSTWRDRLSIWRDPRTLLIGLVVLGMAFAEGSANDWLSLASVDGHGVDNATGALIFGVFVTAMTAGRLGGVLVLDRFGRVPVLRASAIFAVVGLSIFIFVPNPIVATIGVVLWGLGSSLGFPVGMSAAADDPKTAAARVSAVATIGYCAFLIGPPVIGWLGEHFGLLNGLLVVLVLVTVSGLVSGAAREPKKLS